MFDILLSKRLSIRTDYARFDTEQGLAVELASLIQSWKKVDDNPIRLAAVKSIGCRKMETRERYGNCLDYRRALEQSAKDEVTVGGLIEKRGDGAVLRIGNFNFQLNGAVIVEAIGARFTLDDFLYANRSTNDADQGVASRTKGILQYTLSMKDDECLISGLLQPVLTKADAQPVIDEEGRSSKSAGKKELDRLKRNKNMYFIDPKH
jgi:hypothetical protein